MYPCGEGEDDSEPPGAKEGQDCGACRVALKKGLSPATKKREGCNLGRPIYC